MVNHNEGENRITEQLSKLKYNALVGVAVISLVSASCVPPPQDRWEADYCIGTSCNANTGHIKYSGNFSSKSDGTCPAPATIRQLVGIFPDFGTGIYTPFYRTDFLLPGSCKVIFVHDDK